MTRSLRHVICRLLAAALLLAQMSIASYACPVMTTPMAMDAAVMMATDALDDEAATLCIEHCRQGQQTADSSPGPTLCVPVFAALYALPLSLEALPRGQLPPAPDATIAAPPPPHTILHCCMRT